MKPSTTGTELPPRDVRSIPKLTQAYARNRSLGVVVSLVVFLMIFGAISGASHLAGEAYRSGNVLVFWLSIATLIPALAATVYLAVPGWGGRLQGHLVQRLYAKVGNVAFAASTGWTKRLALMLGGFLGICIVSSVVLSFAFEIPTMYLQPISSLYVVPFLVGLWFLMRPMVGYAALLWPLLYALHAVLILVGAPIVFASPWDWLNLVIPTVGYGMLSGLVGHCYSRVALRRLKALAKVDQAAADQPEEAAGQ